MNQAPEHNRTAIGNDDTRHIERLLSHCSQQPIDNTRIKALVREKMMREQLRMQAARRRRYAIGFSAAACIALVVMLGLKFMSPQSIDLSRSTLAEVQAASYLELTVGPGQREELMLADGTRVIANSGSRVLYPEQFGADERRIYACGEVYLQVAKDKDHPFVVESDGFDVKVLGTTFNITNTSDSTASVVLVEGSVEITTDSNRTARMKPNDKVDLSNGEITSLTSVDTSDYTAWTKGLLALHGERLGDIAKRLSAHYDIDIRCDRTLQDVVVYGKLDLRDSVEQALKLIQEIVPMEITRDDSRIILRGDTMK